MGTNIVQALLILLCFPNDEFVTNWGQDPPPEKKKTCFTAGLAWLWCSGTQLAISLRHVYVLLFTLYKGEWVADTPLLSILVNIGWSSNSTDWHCPDDSLRFCCFPWSSLLMLSPTIALQCYVNSTWASIIHKSGSSLVSTRNLLTSCTLACTKASIVTMGRICIVFISLFHSP